MEVLQLKPNDLYKVLNNLTIIRTFDGISFTTARNIQRSISCIEKLTKQYEEDTKLWAEKYDALEGGADGKKTDNIKEKELKHDLKLLNESLIEVKIHILKDSDFPKERKEFGNKEIPMQDGTVRKVSYFEAYLELLDLVIIEEAKFENYILSLRTKPVEKIKSLEDIKEAYKEE